MNRVFVDQEKNISTVVELYKKKNKEMTTININPITDKIVFLDLNT